MTTETPFTILRTTLYPRLRGWAASHRFEAAAVLFGLIFRSIPEIWAGTSPIGFDTVYLAGYFSRLPSCSNLVNQPGELTLGLVACPIASVSGPVMAMKITAVLVYGFFGWSVFYFCRNEVRESQAISFFIAVFVLLEIAALRISWDLYQNLIALSLLLLLLGSFTALRGTRRVVALVILGILITLTHQFVTAFLFMIGAGLFVWALFWSEVSRRTTAMLVIASLALLAAVSSLQVFPTTIYAITSSSYSGYPPYASTAATLGMFLAALYLPTIVPAAIGFRKNRLLLVWSLEIALILLMTVLGFPYLAAFMDRWSLMLVVPLGVFGALGLVNVSRLLIKLGKSTGFVRRGPNVVRGLILLALLVPYGGLALEFMTSPVSHPYWYFDNPVLWRAGASGLPATMLHNTVPFEDEAHVAAAFRWLNNEMTKSDVLLTNPAFYGWALLYLRRDRSIINYAGNNANLAIVWAKAEGFHCVYVVWFIPGYGWDGPDPNFTHWTLAFRDGPIVIYLQEQHPIGKPKVILWCAHTQNEHAVIV